MKQVIRLRFHLGLVLVLNTGVGLAGCAAGEAATNAWPVGDGVPHALTRAAAIRIALSHNPALRATRGKVDAALGQATQARVWPNPELEWSAEEWPVSHGGRFSDSKQTLGVAQTLPFPGKKRLDARIGQAGVMFSEAELDLRRTELVRNVTAAFFSVLAAEGARDVVGELVAVAESSANTARKRVDAGAATYQEQLRAEIQLEQVKADLEDSRRDCASARQNLALWLGRPDLAGARLAGALVESPAPQWPTDFAAEQLAAHPSARAAQANVARAELELCRARLDPYPDVKVGVAGGRLGDTDESIVELRLSFPVPFLDQAAGRKAEARANLAVAEAERETVTRELQREWANALQRYRTAAEQVAGYRKRILPKAAEALRLVQTGFDEGKFSFIDLLDTQRTAAEARRSYQGKLLEMNIAQAELEALLQPQTSQPSTTSKNSP